MSKKWFVIHARSGYEAKVKTAIEEAVSREGIEDLIGSLEIGKRADVVAIDMSALVSQPVYNPLSQLIYTHMGHRVSNVWVNGVQLLKDWQFTNIDSQRVIHTTQQWQAKIVSR